MARHLAPALLIAALPIACQAHQGAPASPASSSQLRCEPDGGFSTPNQNGALVDIPDPSSRATLVEIWARWCKGCEKTVPAVVAQRANLEADGVRVVLLGVIEDGESIDDARATLASWGVNEPFVVDRGGTIMRRYGYSDLPASVVLDSNGNLRWSSSGDDTIDDAMAAARDAVRNACP